MGPGLWDCDWDCALPRAAVCQSLSSSQGRRRRKEEEEEEEEAITRSCIDGLFAAFAEMIAFVSDRVQCRVPVCLSLLLADHSCKGLTP